MSGKTFRLTITPAIEIEDRHAIENNLAMRGYKIIGAGTNLLDNTMDISFEENPKHERFGGPSEDYNVSHVVVK